MTRLHTENWTDIGSGGIPGKETRLPLPGNSRRAAAPRHVLPRRSAAAAVEPCQVHVRGSREGSRCDHIFKPCIKEQKPMRILGDFRISMLAMTGFAALALSACGWGGGERVAGADSGRGSEAAPASWAAVQADAGSRLVEASAAGDAATVRALADANAYVPNSLNALKALQAAKANGHGEVVAVLERELDDYYASGAPYDVLLEDFLASTRERLQDDPDHFSSFDWRVRRSSAITFIVRHHETLREDAEGTLHPMALRFDAEEFERHFDAAVARLAQEFRS